MIVSSVVPRLSQGTRALPNPPLPSEVTILTTSTPRSTTIFKFDQRPFPHLTKDHVPFPHLFGIHLGEVLYSITMSVWVQSRSGNEQPFKVDFNRGMNIDDLKASIILERRARNYPAGLVGSIYSENSDGEMFTLSIDAEVPVPINGDIGSSYEFPYYYSIALLTPGKLLYVIHYAGFPQCPRILMKCP